MSNGSLFEILLYAALAAFVLFRLRSVLGKRTGHEERRDPFAEAPAANDQDSDTRDDDNVISLPGKDRDGPIASADTATDEELSRTPTRFRRASPGSNWPTTPSTRWNSCAAPAARSR